MRREVLRGEAARNLADWSSVWTDLLHARQALAGIDRMPPDWMFERRAMWDSAVMSYGRCFKNGRRRALLGQLTADQSAEDRELHKTLLKWRDKHVGHRVDGQLETSQILAEFDDADGLNIKFQVTTTHAPAPIDIEAVGDYLSRLADTVWTGPLVKGENDLREQLGYERMPFTKPPPDPADHVEVVDAWPETGA